MQMPTIHMEKIHNKKMKNKKEYWVDIDYTFDSIDGQEHPEKWSLEEVTWDDGIVDDKAINQYIEKVKYEVKKDGDRYSGWAIITVRWIFKTKEDAEEFYQEYKKKWVFITPPSQTEDE